MNTHSKLLFVALVVGVIAVAVLGILFFSKSPSLNESDQASSGAAFYLPESGSWQWYSFEETTLVPVQRPESHIPVPASSLEEEDFVAVHAKGGTIFTLTQNALIAIAPETLERTTLFERTFLEYQSAAFAPDASFVVLSNPELSQLDVYRLESEQELLFSYVGSIPEPAELYGVGVAGDGRVVLRTGETTFEVYEQDAAGMKHAGSFTRAGDAVFLDSLFETPVAHAWTYGNPLTASGASTQAGMRCTGSLVANLGTQSGNGQVPSMQTALWNYMGSQPGLPGNYAQAGAYCIQATITLPPPPPPGGGGCEPGDWTCSVNEANEKREFTPLASLVETAHAQVGPWSIAFSIHNGSGRTGSSNHHALIYLAAPTVSLTVNPSSIIQGTNAFLGWSSVGATSCTGTNFNTNNATNGSISVSPSSNTTYSITCVGGGGSVSASRSLTVVPYPNLRAGNISSGSVTAYQPSTFSATITNNGYAATGAGFWVQFERATSAAGANATGFGTAQRASSLAQNGSFTASVSNYFPNSGTWYVRACADAEGSIAESSEGDNCGSWVPVYANPGSGSGAWQHYAVETVDYACYHINPDYAISAPFCPNNMPPSGTCSPLGSFCKTSTFGITNPPNSCDSTVSHWIDDLEVYRCEPAPACSPEYRSNQWYTGGTLVGTAIETFTNSAIDCAMMPNAPASYTHWNREVQNRNYGGVQYYDPITTTCTYYNYPAGSETKNPTYAGGVERTFSSGSVCAPPPAQPNLTAGNVTPTNAVAGQAQTYSSTITNNGTANAVTSQTLFQRATSAGGADATAIGTAATPARASKTSGAVSVSYAHSSAGTTYIRACADSGSAVLESSEGDNCSAWTPVVIGAPDLTASTTSYITQSASPYVWAGQPFTFTSTISNIGNAAANNFPNMFQINGVATLGAQNLSLNAGGSGAISSNPHTFASAGSYSVRSCADFGASSNPVISESNENNNCGPWLGLSVAPPMPTGLAASCNAAGTSATLSWSPAAGSAHYFVRASTATPGVCPSGWVVASWNSSLCYPNPDAVYGTSVVYPATPGFAHTFYVHGSLANGTWGPANSAGFTCNAQLDLTALGTSNRSGSVGSPISLPGTVSNIGNGATPAHSSVFQICGNGSNSSCAAGQVNIQRPTNALAVGGTHAISASWTPSVHGSGYQYRLCADLWSGSVSEVNEDNNCSDPWRSISVAAPAVTCNLSSAPSPLTGGVSSTFTWSSTNATTCTGSGFNTGGATSGTSAAVSVLPGQNYQLQCTGAGSPCVRNLTATTPISYITATPDRVNSGNSASISWSANQVTACTVAANGETIASPAGPTVATSTVSRTITTQTNFTITCDGTSDSVLVNVVPKLEEF